MDLRNSERDSRRNSIRDSTGDLRRGSQRNSISFLIVIDIYKRLTNSKVFKLNLNIITTIH